MSEMKLHPAEAALIAADEPHTAELSRIVARWPEHRKAIALAVLGQALAFCDLMGADAEAFIAHLRRTTRRPEPLVPPTRGSN